VRTSSVIRKGFVVTHFWRLTVPSAFLVHQAADIGLPTRNAQRGPRVPDLAQGRGSGIGAYIRDPGSHLIEGGQATARRPGEASRWHRARPGSELRCAPRPGLDRWGSSAETGMTAACGWPWPTSNQEHRLPEVTR
jgi:hypothetical protein